MILKFLSYIKSVWFWFFSAVFLLAFFVFGGHSFSQVFYFISCLLPIVIATAYYVNEVLIERYLLRKKYSHFVLYLVYSIIISLYLQYLVIFLALIIYSTFGLEHNNLLTIDITTLSLCLYILVLFKVIAEIVRKLNQKEVLIERMSQLANQPSKEKDDKILVRYNRQNHNVYLDTILYIESLSDYIKIITTKGEIITKEQISKISKRLPKEFLRTHRSFIVNSNMITSFNREFVTINDNQVPISRTYKQEVLSFLT